MPFERVAFFFNVYITMISSGDLDRYGDIRTVHSTIVPTYPHTVHEVKTLPEEPLIERPFPFTRIPSPPPPAVYVPRVRKGGDDNVSFSLSFGFLVAVAALIAHRAP